MPSGLSHGLTCEADLSESDHEGPLFAEVNGPLMARRQGRAESRSSASRRGGTQVVTRCASVPCCRCLPLLLLSAQPKSSDSMPTRTAGPPGPRTGSGTAELRITSLSRAQPLPRTRLLPNLVTDGFGHGRVRETTPRISTLACSSR